ncbi:MULTISPECIES: DUF262 domain-containing protein [unclassified Crossiella]|uniref:DUF262 domain-containing protein n=1 Tax=unclassified Crossiella TaxID=2620835 RepID=UPI001FFF16B1|nr:MULTISPECIES: DUF262 domain-containing protein [unclassified Crossiella]MCK2240888.1 DUF262 domain-containing protein [Crossiella sp. S99.2]MCK2253968.1 DUF262 domain-containing protein [Crossiella sp. S99.1]
MLGDITRQAAYSSSEEIPDGQVDEYDLTSAPNDFNVLTIINFIDSGVVKIPGFQRNYVWDIKRASKLIESLIIGLPVPQIFHYERARNNFLVIDGQQRLMTIYYFVKGRFPNKDKRAEIRQIFDRHGAMPEDVLQDDRYFKPFALQLSSTPEGKPNKFTGRKYATLGEYQTQFDLRTIRNVIIKQVKPKDDDSSIYEIFNRLNSSGMSLTPQEIRLSLYHSKFFDMLYRVNLEPSWRQLISAPEPDIHMRDIEILLRAVAVWMEHDSYSGSMVRFLNKFSRMAQDFDEDRVLKIEESIHWFIKEATKSVNPSSLRSSHSRLGITLFEGLFTATLRLLDAGYSPILTTDVVRKIGGDKDFQSYSQQNTTDTANVLGRIARAEQILRASLVSP